MTTNLKKYQFRNALKEDIPTVHEMIQELANFEQMNDGPQLTVSDLIRDAGLIDDTNHNICHIYVLDFIDNHKISIIGYAICFFAYSTWLGRSYFLEDIYIRPEYRSKGAGTYMFRNIVVKAHEYQCKRMDFHVLSWNKATRFYKQLGAIDLTETEAWHYFRLNDEQIKQLSIEMETLSLQ